MPCTPEEAARLAQLITQGKTGETVAEHVPFSLDQPETSVSRIVTAAKLGWFGFARTMRGAFGDSLSVNAIDPLIRTDIKANNFLSKLFKEYKQATREIRTRVTGVLTQEADETLAKALEHVDRNGIYRGPEAAFTPEMISAAKKVRGIYNRLFKEFGIDDDLYRNYYRPLIRQRPSGIFHEPMDTPLENAFRSRLTPEQIKFYHEMERKGTIMDPDPTATAGFLSYGSGLANAKIRRPVIETLEENVINPAFGVQVLRTANGLEVKAKDAVGHGMWKELVHHVFGGPTPTDKILTGTLQGMLGMVGKSADTRTLYMMSHGLSSAFYAGVLGGRPSSVIRQFFQLVPSYAALGPKYIMMGMQQALKKGAIQDLIDKDLITAPIDGLIENINSDVMRGVSHGISKVTDASLKVFSAADQYVRASTALGAGAKFDAYAANGMLEKLGGRREFKDEMMRLVKQGKLDDARKAYQFETVANTQYVFGKANRPMMFRGALGNLASTLMSYPMNSFEMARMFTKQAGQAVGEEGLKGLASDDARPLVRLILSTATLLYVGSEYLNADLRGSLITGSVPHSLAFPKIALDTFQAGTSTGEWLVGDLFNIGETDYHKYQREQYYRDFARGMRAFVPGGILFMEDIPRAIDEGSITRMLALTPKADVLNEQARERARAARPSASGLPTLRGLGGLGGLQ